MAKNPTRIAHGVTGTDYSDYKRRELRLRTKQRGW